jgi:hypothetical protein
MRVSTANIRKRGDGKQAVIMNLRALIGDLLRANCFHTCAMIWSWRVGGVIACCGKAH